MAATPLTNAERSYLLRLARASVVAAAAGEPLPELDPGELTPALKATGASFITLTRRDGSLRGCIGALEARLPLAEDVREHAAAAATEDPRFPPVRPEEVSMLAIEVSRLTTPRVLTYNDPHMLPRMLKPGVDGLILRDGARRATFLPQVWEKVPVPEDFLAQLCQKMGAAGDLWQRRLLQASVYQVEEFSESDS